MTFKEVALYGVGIVVIATLISFAIHGSRGLDIPVEEDAPEEIAALPPQVLSDEQIDALIELLVAYEEDPGVVREVERQLRRR